MSKKLLSLVLACAMVMSVFAVAFSTTAAADEAEETLTYYFLAPEAYGEPNAYWWLPTEAKGWPGTAMTAAPEIGKRVYKIDAPATTSVIIFNGEVGGTTTQTINISIDKDTTGLNNVANMIFVIDHQEEADDWGNIVMRDAGTWCSLDPAADNYYRDSAAYEIEEDSAQTVIPLHDDAVVAGEDHQPATELTYYFYAPAAYGEPNAYWWLPTEAKGWPGTAMTAAPEVGNNVYKITCDIMTTVIIFNGEVGGTTTQTINIPIEKDSTDLNNVGNMIFVIDHQEEADDWGNIVMRDAGTWCSLDPAADNYYRNSAAYNEESDVEVPVVPSYNPVPECGVDPTEVEEETTDEPETNDEPETTDIATTDEPETNDLPATGVIYFKADKEPFTVEGKQLVYFHLWGGATDYAWGSKKEKAELNEETGLWSYPVDFGDAQEMFLIVYVYGGGMTKVQSFDTIINRKAIGNTVVIDDEQIENPVDSSKTAYAAYVVDAEGNKIEGCGPVVTITSTAKIVGTIKAAGTDYAAQLAEKVLGNYKDTVNWTEDSVSAIIDALGLDKQAVQDIITAKVLAANNDEKEDNDYSKADMLAIAALFGIKPVDSDSDASPDTPDTIDTPDDSDAASDVDSESDVDSDSDSESDSDSDVNSDTDSESDVDSDDTDSDDTDTDVEENKLGDTNGDGEVNSADALAILRASVGLDTVSEEMKKIMDLDGDGNVTAADALIALRYSVGIVDDNTQKLIDIYGK